MRAPKPDSFVRQLQKIVAEPSRVLWQRAELLVYECDGLTQHKSRPRAVVVVKSTEETARVVRFLADQGVPFVARGSGTGLSGGSIAGEDAVVIEVAAMRRILSIDPANRVARVEVGVVNNHLNQAVAPHGMHYAPDPSSQMACTIGGNVAENSGGPHCFKYGATVMHVLEVKVVLPDGSIDTFGTPVRGRPGYDLAGLFTGSEGTFGIATEVVVRLTRNPAHVNTILAGFQDLETGCRAVSDMVASGIVAAAIEMLDDRTIAAVEASVFRAGYPQDVGAVLLVELDGPEDEVERDTANVREIVQRHGCSLFEEARDPVKRAKLWQGRKGAFGAMGRVAPDLYVQDAVVPRTKLPVVIREIGKICDELQLRLANVFHAGDGNLHPNISYDGTDPDQVERVHQAGQRIMKLCVEHGGLLTGEHGVGLDKRDYMNLVFDDEDLCAFWTVRDVFDPKRLANPGKLLPMRKCGEIRQRPRAEVNS